VVSVTVEREHTVLRVRVADDGAGVDEIRVRKAAGGNGGALLDVLATPGFSTAPEGGVAAGRGVGLDAVVHSIREVLGGSVRLNNHVGRGFAVEMTIPNAGRQYGVLLVKAGTSVYAVPASGVVDHGELDPRWVRHDSLGNRYYEYLGERLELIALEGAEIGRTGTVVVLSAGDRRAALLVESVLGEEAVVRDLNQPGRVYASTVNRDARLLLPFDILGST
jgi:chemotaxis protein histidine kinase CheA